MNATVTISDRDQKTLDLIEKTRQEVIERTGIDVRTLDESDRWTGLPHDARRALNLELGRRRAVAAGQIPADA